MLLEAPVLRAEWRAAAMDHQVLPIPLRGGCQHRQRHHWPFPSGFAQYRQRTFSCNTVQPFQPAVLCSGHGQPTKNKCRDIDKIFTHEKNITLLATRGGSSVQSFKKNNPHAINQNRCMSLADILSHIGCGLVGQFRDKYCTYLDLIILADWQASYVVLGPHFFGERRTHDLPSDVRRSLEVPFPLLPPGG